MIRVEELVFDYPAVRALERVSFTVEPGTITALVGPNGAGKTTLLRCLAALETPLSGQIIIDGIDVAEEPRAAHRRLGFLQDFYGLYQHLTLPPCLAHRPPAQKGAAARVPPPPPPAPPPRPASPPPPGGAPRGRAPRGPPPGGAPR